jgi:uncharacterized repeat protein (TIGR03843 family)
MISIEEKELILKCLQSGEVTVEGRFMWGSNYTFLCQVKEGDHTIQAVYKPTQGERPLWDFPSESLAGREVAAYIISEAGGWGMVPPTVLRDDGPAGSGSFQFFVDHDPERHYFNFTDEEKERLRPVALFDVIINNTDRKGGHIIFDEDDHIWLIDHGVCFHIEPKLRTVIWDFAGQHVSQESIQQMQALKEKLVPNQKTHEHLCRYLAPQEIQAVVDRIDALLRTGIFPQPSHDRYSYPYPPV